MSSSIRISIAKQFSRWPMGRYKDDGPYSGELFRESILRPAFQKNEVVEVDLNGLLGHGSSFLDEAFAGLLRGTDALTLKDLKARLVLIADDTDLKNTIMSYLLDESKR